MPKDLVITKKEKQKLNKPQQTFNRLVKKLARLRHELDNTARVLSEKLDFYGKHLLPLEEQLVALRVEGVKLFYKFYQDKKLLSKKDKGVLRKAMTAQLNGIFQLSREEPDEEIKEIFQVIEGVSYEQVAADDFSAMKDDMAETFQNMGFDIDLEGFDQDLSEEEMMRKMAEMLGNLRDQAEAQEAARPPRKKTPKQLAKEAREQQIEKAKNKNIATLYKQLARVFHPDLEPDPQLKLHKEDLMKQLTVAYDKGDLHTLLRLELEWIQKEEDNLDKLSDDQLGIYNQVLKQQVEELEMEIELTCHHQRYAPLQRFSLIPSGVVHVNLNYHKREIEQTIADAQAGVARLKGPEAMAEVKEIISIFKRPKPAFNLFDLDLEDFFR